MGVTAAGSAFLAACGGGSKESETGPKGATLISNPEDTSKQAKRGGINKLSIQVEPGSLDVATGQTSLNSPSQLVYSGLVREKPGYLQAPEYSEFVGDLAQSWELSPDKLQITFKLRPGVKFHNRPPINGRAFDAEDVVQSWNHFARIGSDRASTVNSANPNAPVLSVTAADTSTIVFKLKEPVVYLMSRLAQASTGNAGIIIPREAEGGSFDIRRDMIGTGGYTLEENKQSIGLTFKRNPEYWNKEQPYFDQVDMITVPEYATALAQFKVGNIYNFDVRNDDIGPLKREVPALQVFATKPSTANPLSIAGFGWLPLRGQRSPYLDVRVRQAISLAWDRDAFIDTFSNVSKFEAEGFPVQSYYYTIMGPVPGWWLDPKDTKTFGENAKYYTYDVAEAKKLLSAAGYPSGFETVTHYISGTNFGTDHQQQVQVLQQMLLEIGIKPQDHVIDFTSEYIPYYRDSLGKFEGLAWRYGATSSADATDFLVWRYYSKGGPGFLGFDANGRGDQSGDPYVDGQIEKAKAENDVNRRKEIAHDLQRHLAKMQYGVSRPGLGDTLSMTWPALRNYNAFQGAQWTHYTRWLDDTQPPLKRA
jgi:peptide/nickel transport system substrate-binding protein